MITIKPSLAMVIVSAAIGLLICLPGLDAIRLGQWQGVVFILVGCAIFTVPTWRYRISWNEDVLVYRGLISTREIQFSEIRKFEVHGPMVSRKLGPTVGIFIFCKSLNRPAMIINIKPFTRYDIERLTERLKRVCAINS